MPDIPKAVSGARTEVMFALGWLDAIRGPYAVLMLAMLMVASTGAWSISTGETPAVLAWMNGFAAIVSAWAALAEARSARRLRPMVLDHEVRLRVQELGS